MQTPSGPAPLQRPARAAGRSVRMEWAPCRTSSPTSRRSLSKTSAMSQAGHSKTAAPLRRAWLCAAAGSCCSIQRSKGQAQA